MSRPVVTAQPAETVALAAQRMRAHKDGSAGVNDHDYWASGIPTERDMNGLCQCWYDASTGKVTESMYADSLMTVAAVAVGAGGTVVAVEGAVVEGTGVVVVVAAVLLVVASDLPCSSCCTPRARG